MPINEFGIGVSKETQQKQVHFRGLVTYLSTVAMNAYQNFQKKGSSEWIDSSYWIFDLYAARPRYCDDSGELVISSSVIGPEMARNAGWDTRVNLFEILQTNAEALQEYYAKCNNVRIFEGDNADNLGRVMNYKKQRFGYMYIDPNDAEIPTAAINCFYSQKCNSRVDLIVNIAAASMKRSRYLSRYVGLPKILQTLQKHKKFWLVREPSQRHQWTFFVGTNWMEIKGWEKEGFYRLDSDEGEEIWQKVAYTKQDMKEMKQPSFFS